MKILRVKQVGIELEGAWEGCKGLSGESFDDEFRVENGEEVGIIGQDVSVKHPPPEVTQAWERICYGEIASPPLAFSEAEKWIKKHFPKWSDAECGTHFHASFHNHALNYGRLVSREYFDFFLSRAKEWAEKQNLPPSHAFWPRWRGENRFCQKNFYPDKQMRSETKQAAGNERRTILNYCLAQHRTLECRLFPAFSSPELCFSALECYVSSLEDFLRKKKEEKGKEKQVSIYLTDPKPPAKPGGGWGRQNFPF